MEGEAEKQALGRAETTEAVRIQEAGSRGHADVSIQGATTRWSISSYILPLYSKGEKQPMSGSPPGHGQPGCLDIRASQLGKIMHPQWKNQRTVTKWAPSTDVHRNWPAHFGQANSRSSSLCYSLCLDLGKDPSPTPSAREPYWSEPPE